MHVNVLASTCDLENTSVAVPSGSIRQEFSFASTLTKVKASAHYLLGFMLPNFGHHHNVLFRYLFSTGLSTNVDQNCNLVEVFLHCSKLESVDHSLQ